ncbi:hypothetical protein Bbelb_033310 [Branchiostoma belcheri]|nr:hypothetical protein Bbelb_033310 [Branchiostoma belcheri]
MRPGVHKNHTPYVRALIMGDVDRRLEEKPTCCTVMSSYRQQRVLNCAVRNMQRDAVLDYVPLYDGRAWEDRGVKVCWGLCTSPCRASPRHDCASTGRPAEREGVRRTQAERAAVPCSGDLPGRYLWKKMQRRGPDVSVWAARKRSSGRVGRRLLTLGVAFIVTVCLQLAFSRTFSTGDRRNVLKSYNSSELQRLKATEVRVRRPLYVAVQTTTRHLRTYVSAIQNTWASKTDDVHVEFFVDASGKTSSEALRDQTYVKTDEVVTFLRQKDKREEKDCKCVNGDARSDIGDNLFCLAVTSNAQYPHPEWAIFPAILRLTESDHESLQGIRTGLSRVIVGHMGEVLLGEAGWERCADSDVEDMTFSSVLDASVTIFSAPAFKGVPAQTRKVLEVLSCMAKSSIWRSRCQSVFESKYLTGAEVSKSLASSMRDRLNLEFSRLEPGDFYKICSTLAMCEKQSRERTESQSKCFANYIVQVCGTKTTKYSRLFYEAQVEPTYSGQSSVTSGPFDPDFLWRNTHVTSALTLFPVKDAKTTYQLYHYFHGADYSIRRSS